MAQSDCVRSTTVEHCWIRLGVAVVATVKEAKPFKIVQSTLAGTIPNIISISDIEFTREILQCIFVMHRMRFELNLMECRRMIVCEEDDG